MNKKLFFSLLLAAVCGQALAEWVKISHSEGSAFYLDSNYLQKTQGYVMVWVLRDHVGARIGPYGPYLSSKDQLEIDCAARRVRRIYSSDHAQAMGQGEPVRFEHGPMSWNRTVPGTIMARVVEIACARP